MEYLLIPKEFYKNKELNGMERDVLALYKYYTENGNNKCCSLNNTQIAEFLNVSTRYLRMVKKHLKDLGYIRTDGGIKVIYLGVQVGSTVPTIQDIQVGSTVPQVGSTVPTDRKYSSYQVGSTVPIKQEVQFLHKKEKKEKKEIKKEEKKEMTNFDLLLTRLPENYLTQERIDYMKEHYMNKINDVDMSDGGFESWITGIKIELNKIFPQEYKIEKKEEPKIDYIDIF